MKGDIIHYVTQSDIETSKSKSKSTHKDTDLSYSKSPGGARVRAQATMLTTNTRRHVGV